jgi:hypothetical protein
VQLCLTATIQRAIPVARCRRGKTRQQTKALTAKI